MCLFQRDTGQCRSYAHRGVSRKRKMSEHAHVNGIYPFPAVMQTRTIDTNGTSIHVRVGGHGPAVVMLHASAQRAICGVIWRAHSSKTTWLLRPTCVGWVSRRSL